MVFLASVLLDSVWGRGGGGRVSELLMVVCFFVMVFGGVFGVVEFLCFIVLPCGVCLLFAFVGWFFVLRCFFSCGG